MSIQHTVTFRLGHEKGSAEEAEFLATGREELTSIPGVTEFAVNRQVSAKSDLDWQFTMVFADQAAFDAYDSHPTHVAFVESRWVPEVVDFQEFDYVIVPA